MYEYDIPESEARFHGSFAEMPELESPEVMRVKVHLTRPCPTCERENRLTIHDAWQGYHCTDCADAMEGSRQ